MDLTVLDSAPRREIHPSSAQHPISVFTRTTTPAVILEEQDDTSVVVKSGTLCRRNGCKVSFMSDEVNRQDGGRDAVCMYHPAAVRVPFCFCPLIPCSSYTPCSLYSMRVARYIWSCANVTSLHKFSLRDISAANVEYWNLMNSLKYRGANLAVIYFYLVSRKQLYVANSSHQIRSSSLPL